MPTASALETEFALWLRTEPDIPEPANRVQVPPTHADWLFDMVWAANSQTLPLKSPATSTALSALA